MLPNRIFLLEELGFWNYAVPKPYYDRYHLTVIDTVRYYRLAYRIQRYALSVKLISFCVYHTNVSGYHNRLCNPVTIEATKED